MKLLIQIINFNNKDDLLSCLTSLKNISAKAQILVVDNGSTDGSVEAIKKYWHQLRVIENSSNLGFAAGNNVGIRYALKKGATHILFLNPDMVVQENIFPALLKNDADIVAPVIKFSRNGKWVYDLGGRVNFLLGRPRHREVKKSKDIESYPVDYVSGACMLVKREVLEKIKGFDASFFLYFEDVDFCLRAKRAGFKVAVEPRSVVIHKLSEGKRRSVVKNLHLSRSNLIFIRKHVRPRARPFAYFYWLLLSAKILLPI